MTLTYIGDYTHIRSDYISQSGHFTKITDAHLHYSDFMLFPQSEKGEWHTHLVIEVSQSL